MESPTTEIYAAYGSGGGSRVATFRVSFDSSPDFSLRRQEGGFSSGGGGDFGGGGAAGDW